MLNNYANYVGSNPFVAPATLNVIQHLEINLGTYLPDKGMYSIISALVKLADVLAKQTDIDILIEGHTDNVPISTPSIKDNWDLSVLRATAIVRSHDDLIVDGPPPPHDVRLVLQVSRWDRLKDMAGVMRGFVRAVEDGPVDTHLMLVGPDVSGVTDDPEGAEVLAECREIWASLPDSIRNLVHLACIPMDDVDENAIIVNALQRHAYAVVQKSLVEGFGLTVTEAMWKARPMVASGIGGIQDQIVDGRDGLLLADPYDIDAFAALLRRLLTDTELADRLGAAARARVMDEFLGDRHLQQYVELFSRLSRMG